MNRPPMTRSILLGFVTVLSLVASEGAEDDFFERRIRPVLVENCWECHGTEGKPGKGGLRMESREALLRGGESGPALVPGKPAQSLLYLAMSHADSQRTMPPKKSKLSEAVLADVRQWISAGAVWTASKVETSSKSVFNLEARKQSQSWLWAAPKKVKIPRIEDAEWGRDPVDAFIGQRLEVKGLKPAAEIDPRAWLRRVQFAITGLPPSPAEIAGFLADANLGSRERVVDRLLGSPHYGERWARHWMDLMRYAETRGHESDYLIANAWHYRDYLVRAFNTDVAYDRFLLEHLAGDLLPNPRFRTSTDINESVLGTGWVFLGEEVHSPVDIRQDECDRLDNKVDVFTKSFLGLTVSCARCHDHKFDPIRSDDYYGLVGFLLSSSFRQVRFEAMENNRRMADELATVRQRWLPSVAAESGVVLQVGARQLAVTLNEAVRGFALATNALAAPTNPASLWTTELRGASTNPWHVLHRVFHLGTPTPAPRDTLAVPVGGRVIADFTRPKIQPWKVDGEAFGRGPILEGTLVPGLTVAQPLAGIATFGSARRDPFWNRIKSSAGNEDDSGRLGATSRAGRMLRTPTVTLGSGRLHYLIRGRVRVYAAVDSHLMVDGPLHQILNQTFDSGTVLGPVWVTHNLGAYAGHRTHLEFGPDGDHNLEVLMVVESDTAPDWKPSTALTSELSQARTLSEFTTAFQALAIAGCDWLAAGAPLPSPNGIAAVTDWMVRNPGLLGVRLDRLRTGGDWIAAQNSIAGKVRWESRTAVALLDGTGVDEFVLIRGKPSKIGARAPRSLPVAFSSSRPIELSDGSGRLELGRQLVDKSNPLVARVMVNRVWHHLFGRGLVPTVDNFGALGEAPVHPELLDHLAWQFVHDDDWSIKQLIRRLVLTRTFALGNRPTNARALEVDPLNNFWHFRPVRRLEAEVIRDALMVVSGEFNSAMNGPPVPVYLNEFVIGRGRPDSSGSLEGDGRRSLYTAVRRNFLPTSMLAFDFPTPFSTVGRRNVSLVPSQALARMNDPLFGKQSRVWANKITAQCLDSPGRIRGFFESAYGRWPSAQETSDCLAALEEFRRLHPKDPKEFESWVDLAHTLLNANEFIYLP